MKNKILLSPLFYVFFVLMSSIVNSAEGTKSTPEIIAMAKPSIVRILYEIKPGEDALLQFYQVRRKITEPLRALSGSGFVVNQSGYILTNYHVTHPLGLNPNIYVRIPGEGDYPVLKEYPDKERNLTLLYIQKFDLKPLVLGESEIGKVLKEGQDLIAIGFPFAAKISDTTDKEPSATRGIISAFKQTAQEATFIQTDASVNEGTSGGPAFNTEGHVIGVIFAGAGKNDNVSRTYRFIFGTREERPPTNISFVVPIDHTKHMLLAAKVEWLKPGPVVTPTAAEEREEEKSKWFGSPKFYIPVGALILFGVIAAVYIESAKKRKMAASSSPSISRGSSSTQTQPLSVSPSSRATAVSVLGSLKCTGGELAGKTFTVSERGVNIGRGPGNEVQLSSDVVSRRQAWIGPVAGEVVVKDLGSTNGTFVNDQQVTGERRLRSGDTIRITKNGNDVFTFSS